MDIEDKCDVIESMIPELDLEASIGVLTLVYDTLRHDGVNRVEYARLFKLLKSHIEKRLKEHEDHLLDVTRMKVKNTKKVIHNLIWSNRWFTKVSTVLGIPFFISLFPLCVLYIMLLRYLFDTFL